MISDIAHILRFDFSLMLLRFSLKAFDLGDMGIYQTLKTLFDDISNCYRIARAPPQSTSISRTLIEACLSEQVDQTFVRKFYITLFVVCPCSL